MDVAAPRPTASCKRLLSLFPQGAEHGIRQGHQQRILCGSHQYPVKIKIAGDELLGVYPGFGRLHRLLQGVQIRLVPPQGGAGSDLRFQNRSDLNQILPAIPLSNLDHHVEGVANGAGGALGDECAAPRPRLSQPLLSQDLHGFSHSGPANAKLLGELSFRRESIPGNQFAGQNLLFDLGHDLFVEPARLDLFVRNVGLGHSMNRAANRRTTYALRGQGSPWLYARSDPVNGKTIIITQDFALGQPTIAHSQYLVKDHLASVGNGKFSAQDAAHV